MTALFNLVGGMVQDTMTTSVDKSKAIRLHLVYKDRVCPGCGHEQTYGYCTPGRYIQHLDEVHHVTAQTVYCTHGACPLRYKVMHPPEEWSMAPPVYTFGFDVIGQTGQLRYGEKMTRAGILTRLLDEHPNLRIGERSVQNLYELYGHLISGTQLKDPELIQEIKANKAMVLGLDGAQPMKGHETVWFARDLITGRTLAAAAMRSTTARDLGAFLRPIRDFADRHGTPVVGIVSDKEGNIVKAVKRTFPRVRHQFCQIHYVNNMAKPLAKKDSSLRKDLRKGFRRLREVEREIPTDEAQEKLTSLQVEALQTLCLGLQSILKDNGKPPFDPPGLKLYDGLVKLRERVQRMRREKGGPVFALWTSSSRSSTSSSQRWIGFATTTRTSWPSGTPSSRGTTRLEPRSASSGR